MRPTFRFLPTLLNLAVLLLLVPPIHAPAPLCDVTCEPDPGSPSYGATFTARYASHNSRGGLTIYTPPTHPQPVPTAIDAPPRSESYNYAVPILSLAGRNGLDLNLALFYSSRLWTIDKVNNTATFNADRDYPSYGSFLSRLTPGDV